MAIILFFLGLLSSVERDNNTYLIRLFVDFTEIIRVKFSTVPAHGETSNVSAVVMITVILFCVILSYDEFRHGHTDSDSWNRGRYERAEPSGAPANLRVGCGKPAHLRIPHLHAF